MKLKFAVSALFVIGLKNVLKKMLSDIAEYITKIVIIVLGSVRCINMMDLIFLKGYKELLEKDYLKQLYITVILLLLMIVFAYAEYDFFGGATASILVISCIKLHSTVKEIEAVERDLNMPDEVIRSINHEKD